MTSKANKNDANISFEIGLSQIHSNVFNNQNITANNKDNNNKTNIEACDRSNIFFSVK